MKLIIKASQANPMNLFKITNKNVDHVLIGVLNLMLLVALPAILGYFAFQIAITDYEAKFNHEITNEITANLD